MPRITILRQQYGDQCHLQDTSASVTFWASAWRRRPLTPLCAFTGALLQGVGLSEVRRCGGTRVRKRRKQLSGKFLDSATASVLTRLWFIVASTVLTGKNSFSTASIWIECRSDRRETCAKEPVQFFSDLVLSFRKVFVPTFHIFSP